MKRSFLDPALSATRSQRRRLTVIIVLAVTGLIVLVLGTIGLLLGPPDPTSKPESPASGGDGSHAEAERPRAGEEVSERQLPKTDDAERFARAIAEALFSWDTSDGYMPRDYAEIIVEAGAQDSEELNGLAHDVTTYLPTETAWVELQKYDTRQHLEITQIRVPDQWEDVLAQARDNALLPGTVAYTVDGTRHRSGVWDGEDVTTEHPVAFTLFILCPPEGDACELLRLSALDKPLT